MQKKDVPTFEQVYCDNYLFVLSCALQVVQNSQDAEDLTQEVFITALQRNQTDLPWLTSQICNMAVEHCLQQTQRFALETSLEHPVMASFGEAPSETRFACLMTESS
ncbi:hypothetical protein KSF_107450 [Reticulibacter mediterranei]|uniref:RNA polymerase sigma-70 region 2 domain-containing protein n=1 Tax=Reticulibacter mediterranei TaxID=2778369 RepID=A0A8J3NAS3_9CHLR|nr:sigma factor [Reticulibacter mediterranei]GHP00698.1 hypothetical protein KSF_107450 [Reticulibacter mediterranei]